MRVKIEAGCGMTKILIVRCGVKIGLRDRDVFCFVGGIGVRTSRGEIII